jgi:hypothetical protein
MNPWPKILCGWCIVLDAGTYFIPSFAPLGILLCFATLIVAVIWALARLRDIWLWTSVLLSLPFPALFLSLGHFFLGGHH